MQVFISHSTPDDDFVRALRIALEKAGVLVWADSRELTGGAALTPEIEAAIENAEYVIAVLSFKMIGSEWVAKEIRRAESLGKKIIPILLDRLPPNAQMRWLAVERVAIPIERGPGGLQDALPKLLAALGLELPNDPDRAPAKPLEPVADLVLKLTDPSIFQSEGKRRAQAVAALTFCPADGAPPVESVRFNFISPLGPIEAEEISWYLERYVNWPSEHFRARAQRVEEKLPEWGQMLYRAIDNESARAALESWKAAKVDRRFSVLADAACIAGTSLERQADANEAATLLFALPWELIHDGRSYLFQGAGGVRVRRRLPNRNPQEALASKPPIRVLLVSPRPEDESAAYIDHRISVRPVAEALSQLGALAQFKLLTPPTFPAMQRELQRARDAGEPYHAVHFDGHGVYRRKHGLGALCFENLSDAKKRNNRRSELIGADRLAEELRGHRVPLFFLEACQTAMTEKDPTASVAGKLLECGVASVVAMSHSVLVETARRFVTEFYREIVGGKRVGQAMLAGQLALKRDTFRVKTFAGELRLEDWFVPVLFQEEQDPAMVLKRPLHSVQPSDAELGKLPLEPGHTFVGRSRELLTAERVLEHQRYVVIRGEGGEGKTTLAAELARWLVLTRRCNRAVFVSLERDGNSRSMMRTIGEQLMPIYLAEVGADEKKGMQLIARALGDEQVAIVLDNMESVLPPSPGSVAEAAFDPEALQQILDLCNNLQAKLIFTSREAMPEPFATHEVHIGRLDPRDAIALVGRKLGEGNLMPGTKGEAESEEEVGKLVETVGCHARSLVLLADEIADKGIRITTENLHALMAALHKRYPDDRERSLFASVELSLRRLSPGTREKIRPLAVFQGGGSLFAIAAVLHLDTDKDEEVALAWELVGVGLAEMLPYNYLRFDPALGPALLSTMSEEERQAAHSAWVAIMAQEADALTGLQLTNPEVAFNLASLDIANLVGCLEFLSLTADAERAVRVATDIETLISRIGKPKVLERVASIRSAAARTLGAWGHAAYLAQGAAIDRLLDTGRFDLAIQAAKALLNQSTSAGEAAFREAALDIAFANFKLGRCLQMAGSDHQATAFIDESRRRFEDLGERSMAGKALGEKADCLRNLGRLGDSAVAYSEALEIATQQKDIRTIAVGTVQLATVRMMQGRYEEALKGFHSARNTFQGLGDSRSVAAAWHQIGRANQDAGQFQPAEQAFQQSLGITMQIGDRSREAATLTQLGSLYSEQERHEDAVAFYGRAAETYSRLSDSRDEAVVRSNLAISLRELHRYDEARQEIERAIALEEPFGHTGEPWKSFDTLRSINQATGNHEAALEARQRAMQAYLSYRRDGGENHTGSGELCAAVSEGIQQGQPAPVRQSFSELPPDHPLVSALQAILSGSRDPALAEDPNLDFDEAVELQLLLEKLTAASL